MSPYSMLSVATVLCLWSRVATGSPTKLHESSTRDAAGSHCHATKYWPGWEGIKYAFVLSVSRSYNPKSYPLTKNSGDSYTTTTFNVTGVQPTPTNPLGNPTYPGYTASDGPNWVDYITVKYNSSIILTYNIAYGGATIDSELVAPYLPTVSSVAEQVENEWFPTYASKPASAQWSSDNTLFAIFDGINDVGNSYYQGVPATTTLNNEIFAVFHGLVDELYYAGARNFAFLNVPPVDRAPLTLEETTAAQAEEKADILAWNELLINMAHELKMAFNDINVFTVDTNSIFTRVLENPRSNPLTAGYRNTTDYCVAYEK